MFSHLNNLGKYRAIQVGDVVRLSNGIRARVTEVTPEKVRIDANPVDAGKMVKVEMTCLDKKPANSLKQATFGNILYDESRVNFFTF